MSNIYFAVHISFENTNAVFLDQVRANQYINEQISRGVGINAEWKLYSVKEGQQFDGNIHFPIFDK
jgi:hypothetical protein